MATNYKISTTFAGTDQMSSVLANISSNSNKSFTKIKKQSNQLNKSFEGLKTSLLGLTAGFGVAAGFSAGIVEFSAMEDKLLASASAFKVFDKSSETFKKLQQSTVGIGENIGSFTISQRAEALEKLALAGFSVENSIKSIPQILDFAKASSLELGIAADIATDAVGAFGLESKDLSMIMDSFISTSQMSNTNVEMLFEGFKLAAPAAVSFGQSIEDTNAALGVLADSGLKGSIAGTSLKSALTNLVKPTGELKKFLDRVNISARASDGSMRPLIEVMTDLRKVQNNLKSPKQLEEFEQGLVSLFGKEGLAGGLNLLSSTSGKWQEYSKKLDDAGGTTKKTADLMNTSLSSGFNSIIANFGKLFAVITLTAGSSGLGNFLQVIGETIGKIADWISSNQELIQTFIEVGKYLLISFAIIKGFTIISSAIALVKGLAFAVKGLTVAQIALNVAMSANPIYLAVVAISGLIALIIKAKDVTSGWLLPVRKIIDSFRTIGKMMGFDLGMTLEEQKQKEQEKNNAQNKDFAEIPSQLDTNLTINKNAQEKQNINNILISEKMEAKKVAEIPEFSYDYIGLDA